MTFRCEIDIRQQHLWCANLHKILVVFERRGAIATTEKRLSCDEIKFHKFLITALWYSHFNRNLWQIALLNRKRSGSSNTCVAWKSLVIEVIKNSSNISCYLNYNSFPLDLSRRNCFPRKLARRKTHCRHRYEFSLYPSYSYAKASIKENYGPTYEWRKVPGLRKKFFQWKKWFLFALLTRVSSI